jgi:DUF883 C-terminal glycine zipper region
MDTYESRSYGSDMHDESGIKNRLGRLGRRIKHIDLRSQIADHPFTAVGIAVGAGALVGLLRPMPHRGRVSGTLVAVLTAIGFRLVREAAIIQLGQYARDMVMGQPPPGRQSETKGQPQGTRYGY